jgi:hypothetical protein
MHVSCSPCAMSHPNPPCPAPPPPPATAAAAAHLDGLRQLLGDALRHLAQLTQGPVGLQASQGAGQATHWVLVAAVVLSGQRYLQQTHAQHIHVGALGHGCGATPVVSVTAVEPQQ